MTYMDDTILDDDIGLDNTSSSAARSDESAGAVGREAEALTASGGVGSLAKDRRVDGSAVDDVVGYNRRDLSFVGALESRGCIGEGLVGRSEDGDAACRQQSFGKVE